MRALHASIRRLARFRRDDNGAALVEFAIVLPLMLILFGVTVEGARMMQSYQSANAGVRDASRYLARVAPANSCVAGTAFNISSTQAKLLSIVDNKVTNGTSSATSNLQVVSVVPTLRCVSGTPVARVTATLRIAFPFGNLLELGGRGLTEVTTTITDEARIFGT